MTLPELQRSVLTPDDVLLDFSVGQDRTYLFAITRDSCRVVAFPGRRSSLTGRAELFVQSVGTRPDSPDAIGGAENAGRVLGDILLGDVVDLLESATRLIVVPDAFLSAMPFGALAPGGHTLLDRLRIVQVPTTGVLGRGGVPEPVPSDIAVIAGAGDNDAFGEVGSLQSQFEGVTVVSGHGGAAALLASARDVIHIAAHIDVNDERPWRSRIQLETRNTTAVRGATVPAAGTGILASDVLGMEMHAPLAVLAGCESGLGRLTQGEGVQGLTAAFLVAGVRTVVATLWRVDDDATRTLMEHFYHRLSTGEPVAESLRGAQVSVRANPATRHPYYWAGFVVVGSADTVLGLHERGPFARYSTQLIVIIGVVVLGALAIRARWNSRRPV